MIQFDTIGSHQNLHKPIYIGGETKNVQARRKQKGKEKRNIEFKPKEAFDPANGASGSRKDKHERSNKRKCSYYKKGNHTEKYCMKNTIDQMEKILEHHNISLPKGARKTEFGEKSKDHDERCHALKARCSKTQFKSLQ